MQLQRKTCDFRLSPDLASLIQAPTNVCRTVAIDGTEFAVELEDSIWDSLDEIAQTQRRPLEALCADVLYGQLRGITLASALRVFVLNHFRCA